MTGKVLIFPEIIDNQEAIDYVVEKYFKETEKTGNNSSMVQRIYSPKFPKEQKGVGKNGRRTEEAQNEREGQKAQKDRGVSEE